MPEAPIGGLRPPQQIYVTSLIVSFLVVLFVVINGIVELSLP